MSANAATGASQQSVLLNRSDLLRYSFLALPLAFAGLPMYVHAPDFYVREQGLSLAAIGFLLLFLRAADAVFDPVIGYLSDRFHSLRKLVLIGSLFLLGVSFIGLFNPRPNSGFGWFGFWTFFATFAYSIATINLNALGGLWSSESDKRVQITTWREGFSLGGVLLASIFPAALGNWLQLGPTFSLFSLLFVLILLVAALKFLGWMKTQRAQPELQGEDRVRIIRMLGLALSHRSYRRFFVVYLFSSLASAIPAVLVLFFIEERLGSGEAAGWFLMLFFLAGVISMPLWQRFAAKTSPVYAWRAAMLIAIVSFVWAGLLGHGDLIAYAFVCVGSGVALGGELALPPAILAGMIHRQKQQRQATSWFAWMAFFAKLNLALAAGIAFPFLEFSGFTPGQENSEAALQALSLTYAFIPCGFKLIALLLLGFNLKADSDPFEQLASTTLDKTHDGEAQQYERHSTSTYSGAAAKSTALPNPRSTSASAERLFNLSKPVFAGEPNDFTR